MKTKYFLFLFYLIIICSSAFSQNQVKIDSMKNCLKQSTDNVEKVKLLNELCWIHRNTNTDSALIYGTRALELSDSIGDIEDKIKALSFTGVVYRNKGIYAKALELYYEGAKLAQQYNNYEQLTYAYINIGNIHIYRNEMNQALIFFKKAFESSKNTDNVTQQAYIYYNLGRTYTELGNYSKARYFVDQVMKMREKNHDEDGLAIAKKNLGDIFLQENKTNEALNEYEEALKISKRLNTNKTIIATLKNEIAKIYASQKKFKKAEQCAKKSLKISREIGAKFRAKEASLTLANIYSSQGLFKKAYHHYLIYSAIKDSLFSAESNRQINSIQTLYKIDKKERENELLKIGKLNNLAKIKQQEIIGVLIIGILLILIIFVFILLHTLKQKKLSNKLLIRKNHEIEEKTKKILAQDKALKENEKKYRNILNNMMDVYYQTDNNQNLIFANPAGAREFGYDSVDEMLGKNVPETIYYNSDDRKKFLSVIKEKGKVENYEVLLKHKNGKLINFEINSKIMRNETGKPIGIEGIMRNITKRKENLQEINKLSTAIEQSPTTILITDLKGNIEYSNPQFEKLTGYTTKEIIGLNSKFLQSGETPRETYVDLWKTITSGKIWMGEFINKKKNNEKFIEKAIISPIKNDVGKIVNYIAIKEDITKQKETEQELKKAKEQAEKLNATKDKFFSIIAHDLKNPFNALIGFSDLLLSSHKNIDEEKREMYIKNIHKSAVNIYELLGNLLLWAHTQRGTMQFNPEQISLITLFQNIVELHEETAKKKEISLNYFIKDDIIVEADKNMLTSVINNLITNALKFTNIKGKVNLSAILTDNNAKITVEDDGVGMDEETKNKLFGLNTNQSTEGTAGEMGTGLGLILCKEFVEKSGGKIWIESEVGKGSRFIFTLPVK